jgi:hypothetical protein
MIAHLNCLLSCRIWWKKRSRRIEYQRVDALHDDEDKAPWKLFKRGGSSYSGKYPLAYELPEQGR